MPISVAKIKNEAKRQGQSKRDLFYVKPDESTRVRFLVDIEDGIEFIMFNEFGGVRIPDPAIWRYDNSALIARADDDDDKLKREIHYGWPLWNYDQKRLQILHGKPNQWSPVMQILAAYEEYGSITDRDYNIRRQGESLETSYSLFPGPEKPFKVRKANRVPNEQQMFQILYRAYLVEPELVKMGLLESPNGSTASDEPALDDDDEWDDV